MHVVDGTPGHVFDMLCRNSLCPDYINMFVLDEADEITSRGFKENIFVIFQLFFSYSLLRFRWIMILAQQQMHFLRYSPLMSKLILLFHKNYQRSKLIALAESGLRLMSNEHSEI